MPIIGNFRYRPEVDGLRAVAVLSVVLFHAGFGCSGGYVGVDVFFVISGFLITSLIWKDLEAGSFTFAHFWERRARRIVPALVVVTLAILIAGWFLLLPADFASLGRAAASQALFAANIHYWRDSGYFAGVAEEKPLLHTWSLAVEEQFYLFVPFLLWGMYRSMVLRRRTWVVSLVATAFVLSLVLSIYAVVRFPGAAFYLLPTRAWELLLGSLLAFMPVSTAWLNRRSLREILSVAGLALIIIPVFIYTSETPFPGLAALPPCLGAALFIWSNGRTESRMPTLGGTLLSVRPVVFIGLISYSLYLWHWPFIAFNKYLALVPPPAAHRAVLLGAGFLFAILSWKYVETPFRERRIGASRKAIFTYAGAGLVSVFGCGLLCMIAKGFPQRLPAEAVRIANAKFDGSYRNLTIEDIRAGRLTPIGVQNPALRPMVLVWGDSHAMAMVPAVDALLKEKGMAGRVATHVSTAPILGWFKNTKHGMKEKSIDFNDEVFRYVRSRKIPVVILNGFWSDYTSKNGSNSGPLAPALVSTIQRLVAIGVQPWFILDVPTHPFDVPTALGRSAISRTNIAPVGARRSSLDKLDGIDPEVIKQIETAGGRVINPKPKFLDPTGQHYVIQVNGVVLYRDEQHMTDAGAKLTILPLLRESLNLRTRAITK